MTEKILLEIEHTRLVPFVDLHRESRGNLVCTTLADNQKKAVFRLFLDSGTEKKEFHHFEISGIPSLPAGEPRFDISAARQTRRTLHLRASCQGRKVYDRIVPLPRRKGSRWWLFIVVLLVIGAGFGSYFGLTASSKEGHPEEISYTPQSENARDSIAAREAEPRTSRLSGGPAGESTDEPAVAKGDKSAAGGEENDPGPAAVERLAGEPAVDEPESAVADESGKQPAQQEALPALDETVYFEPESYRLLPAARQKLTALAGTMENGNSYRYTIEGHCAPFGSEASRRELSEQRAGIVYTFLIDSGWTPAPEPRITGWGAERPVTNNPDMQHLNRRVEIAVEAIE